MSVDPSVTAALERAVSDDPGNAALRLHMAALLVVAGDPEPAGLDEIDELEEALGPRVTLADVGGLDTVKARLDAAFLRPGLLAPAAARLAAALSGRDLRLAH